MDINERGDVLILFDVDGTLTPARQNIQHEMDNFLTALKEKVTIGLVGGSDLKKIAQQTFPPKSQLESPLDPIEVCVKRFDYVFAENGLVAYRNGQLLAKQNIINHIGEQKLQTFINFCLRYMSELELPVKRGNFVEFRNGLINICPVGRSCSQMEREQFNRYDSEHKVREKFIEQLKSRFGPDSEDPIDLVYSIGGQISFDVFPRGWDKTFCLNFVDQSFKKIYFFGDKTFEGGNDFEIYQDKRTIASQVKDPSDTMEQLKALKFL